MYGIDGRTELPERELGHLAGYWGSVPVRTQRRGQAASARHPWRAHGLGLPTTTGTGPSPAPSGARSRPGPNGSAITGTSPTRASGRSAVALGGDRAGDP